MIAALLLLSACENPGMPDLADGPYVVPTEVIWQLDLDAHYPTDVLQRDDGELWVLDGYAHQILRYDAQQQALPPHSLPAWTSPSRMAPASAGGIWLADPLGHVLRMDAEGVLQQPIQDPFEGSELHPISVLEQDGVVYVSDRGGALRELDPVSQTLGRVISEDANGKSLGVITDMVPHPDGGVLAIDTLRTALHHVEDGRVVSSGGRFGMWAGAMMKPKAIARGPDDTVLVADSALDVVQVFDFSATGIGMLADSQGEPIRMEHPDAIEALGADEYLVLDASGPTVLRIRVPAAGIQAARDEARTTHALRYPLRGDNDDGVAGDEGETCLQCHDGLVLDDRQVWQKDLSHHPVDIVPDTEIPSFFPLDEQGRLRCTTCHSPHGAADASEAAGVGSEEERLALVRHSTQGEFFTRLSRGDSALCEACHTDAAHDDAVDRLALSGSAHLVGKALESALEKRYGEGEVLPEDIEKGCLGCHSPHAAQSTKLLRSAGDGKGCVSCHEPQADSQQSHPIGLAGDRPHPREAAGIPVDREGRVDCSSCHQLVGGSADALLRTPTDGGDLCIVCHADRVRMLSGPHGKIDGEHDLTCLGCHDVHEQSADAMLRMDSGGAADPHGCTSCHYQGSRHNARGVAPGKRGHVVDGQRHDGLDGPLTCETCHDPHRPEPGACGDCHAEQAEEQDRGGHGTAACVDCHPAHDDAPLASDDEHNPRSWTCLACHGAERGRGDIVRVAEFEHPAPVFEPDGTRWEPLGTLPLFAPDGSTQPAGVNGEMTCMTCHRVHGPDPVTPKSKLKRPGWEKPCAACHGENALALYK